MASSCCSRITLVPKGDNNRKLSDEQRDEIARTYATPLPDGTWVGVTTIARQFGVSKSCVQYHLRMQGVVMRSPKEAHSGGKACRPVKNPRPPRSAAPECKCGCGQRTEWSKAKNKWRVYFNDHYRNPPGWVRPERARYRKGFIGPREEPRYRGSPGDRNGSWKGGVTPERQRLYRTPGWKALVQEAWKRDGYICQRCGAGKTRGRKLHAHHVVPWSDAPGLRLAVENLATLCDDCHRWVHSLANESGEFLACAYPEVPAAGGRG